MHRSLTILFVLLAASFTAAAAETTELRLIPFPKEVRLGEGTFSLKPPLRLEVPASHSAAASRLLEDELRRAGLPPAQVVTQAHAPFAFRLSRAATAAALPEAPAGEQPEAYALAVRADEVVGVSAQAPGLLCSLQTLCQLIRANRRGEALPVLAIRDWPSLRWRAFQDDMTRGPSSTLETLQFEASLAAYLKLNLMTYYMEYQYAFRKHPQIGPADGSLTPEDLSALVAYAQPLGLDILGNQQSFGHFAHILKHPEFVSLRETADVLTPVNEATYRLLDDFYSEICPRLPFPWFNVCCDETYGLGTGPSRQLASEIGVGGVYVRHIRRVHDLLRDQYGKRMMMWGDIILQHPDRLGEIPRDTLMLTWGYDARPSFEDQIVPFVKAGYAFFVCPGVNNWSRILPDFGVAVTNIQHFIRDGVKHGALGMINTDWEDDGEALNGVKWHADAWAAECAWNGAATPYPAFNRRVGAVLFGESGDHFGQAIERLTQIHRLPIMKGGFNARFWEADFTPRSKPAAIQSAASSLLDLVRPALQHLDQCQREALCNQHLLEVLRFGARRLERIGQRQLDGLDAAQQYERACADPAAAPQALEAAATRIRDNRDAHEALGRQFAQLWHAESKPYALDWTLRRYTNAVGQFDALLRRVTQADEAFRAGQPLPAPEEIGLSLPKPLTRRLQPRAPVAEPLEPRAPWLDANATHRLGLDVHAGATDRHELPIEVALSLPPALASRPVRAFRLDHAGQPQELLAQLDPLPTTAAARLVLLLGTELPKNQHAAIHVYLGLESSPALLPGAVRTWTDTGGQHWIENDRIRALLGPEGGHIYRWEAKSAANRDLTMPGTTDWAGFSDIGTYRATPYRLEPTARGPALVEFQCHETTGQPGKTIRFYGSASWIEVFLESPTSVYWDFDDPKNFAADGPTPGTWLFSNGRSGPVGSEADGVPAQVRAADTFWGVKFNADKLALGMITPGTPAMHLVAPGAGAGGVGIEGSPPVQHCVTFAGRLDAAPDITMERLASTLDLKRPVSINVHALQTR